MNYLPCEHNRWKCFQFSNEVLRLSLLFYPWFGSICVDRYAIQWNFFWEAFFSIWFVLFCFVVFDSFFPLPAMVVVVVRIYDIVWGNAKHRLNTQLCGAEHSSSQSISIATATRHSLRLLHVYCEAKARAIHSHWKYRASARFDGCLSPAARSLDRRTDGWMCSDVFAFRCTCIPLQSLCVWIGQFLSMENDTRVPCPAMPQYKITMLLFWASFCLHLCTMPQFTRRADRQTNRQAAFRLAEN